MNRLTERTWLRWERGALKEWKSEAVGNYCSDSSHGTRHPPPRAKAAPPQ